jgi:hypothetical protein
MIRNELRYENASLLRRTLIRKTSLLHKIDPTALRSSFADIPGVSNQVSVIRIFLPDARCLFSDPRMEIARRP